MSDLTILSLLLLVTTAFWVAIVACLLAANSALKEALARERKGRQAPPDGGGALVDAELKRRE